MKYQLTVDGVSFKARGVYFKEIKELIGTSKEVVSEVFDLLDQADIVSEGTQLLIKYLDVLTEMLAKYTSLTVEAIETLELVTLVHILDELLKINGIHRKKVWDFLKTIYLERVQTNQKTPEMMYQDVVQS